MIIFYDKATGKIEGTVNGRIHSKDHLKMWVGDKTKTDRLIVNWKPIKWYNQKGKEVVKGSKEVFAADFAPEHKQADLFFEFDKDSKKIYDYKVDVKTKELIKNG